VLFRHSGPDFHRDKLQPESSLFNMFRHLWTPVFTGVTTFYEVIKVDGFVKSPVPVIARSSALAGRRSNLVFSGTFKNEIASLPLKMTLSRLFTRSSKFIFLFLENLNLFRVRAALCGRP